MTTNADPSRSDGILHRLETLLSPVGLVARGGFTFGEDAPGLPDGQRARSLVLIGHAGSSFWPHFDRFRADYSGPDPLDTWTRQVIEPVAAACGSTALYPFDKPWWPFQQWISRCEGLRPSPLGILIHPDYGLWHGYRAALAFAQRVTLPPPADVSHPCDDCSERPCITACPAGAVSDGPFGVGACREFLSGPAGGACLSPGCLSRDACPVGRDYRYSGAHRQFLMQALDLSYRG